MKKETKIVVYPFGEGWFVKILFSFKINRGIVVFESSMARHPNLQSAKKLANRIRRELKDESISTVVRVVERDSLV